MSIGQNIKRLRCDNNMTQQQLADELGLQKSYICMLERDSRALTLVLSNQIASIFNVPIDELLQ